MSPKRPLSLPVTVVLALGALIASLALAAPANAAHRYSATVRSHVTKTVHSTISTTVAATASATVGYPPVTARVTVHVTGRAKAAATRTAWATARRSAGSAKKAKKAARHAARTAAARLAQSKAAAVARARALASARSEAQSHADAQARAAAQEKARSLAGLPSTATSSNGCTPLPKTGGGSWTCTFDEEFDGTKLDGTKWIPVTTAQNGYAGGPACLVDSPDNIAVKGGVLNLTVRKTPESFVCKSPKAPFTTSYTGGQVATYGKFAQTYGRYAVRAKFPAATVAGLQSTLWLWPQNNIATGLTGEIDIAEFYSRYPDRAIPYLHYVYDPKTSDPKTQTNVVTNNYCLIADVNAFHEYAVEWTPSTITVQFDGKTCLVDRIASVGASPFNQPYFIALTACLGITTNAFDPARTPLPATTQVDWVRAWK